jgi:peptidoglycan-N-acetylglucosamine deacetylase
LTFDDGPDPAWTPQVLELLRQHSAVATFCVVGNQARKHPELLRDIVDAGMRLCDHTRTHPADLTVTPVATQQNEVVGARDELRDLVDAPVVYFRAPGGHFSPALLQLAVAQGMQPLGWSVDLRDWERPGRLQILTTLERNLRPGAVILMHDGGGDRSQTVEALGLMLPWLAESGYRFTFPTP